ncbi:hypothetical protein QQP08_012751 [Theobroma cacao]|nr:hypothetical protein QQP08_012751 [Theobroma cacao]
MDPNLVGDITPLCLKKFGELAGSCIRDNGIERPMMSDVVWGLEFALQIQGATGRNMMNREDEQVTSGQMSPLISHGVTTIDDDDLFSVSSGQVPESRSTISSGGRSANRILSSTHFNYG